ncbi:uncharacterized protein B0P05DRAFT_577930 [Gilbertella persicaria]|uniref:Peptidase M13 n=1 Tax=Rhizopus stolonifer TaxID=4846 RepID=A0A367KT00_RHIST|nr:uncharacterized protein B0P05DRAFT_577930 [Gilbertella persicaria]KAI8087607.1 hypothetical protein B0P05DRAFT_577930 [Gilbertella persicaria]RCI05328.1 Peptidase M13 [Rhizopus stolonifer]
MIGAILPNSLSTHSTQLLARSETCTTQVCRDTASSILHDLDLNADPCSDFYQYTSIGTFAVLRNANLDDLSQILSSTYDSYVQDIKANSTNSSDLLNDAQALKDRENFDKIKDFYQSCMNEDAINSLGPTPMYPQIAQLLAKLGYSTDLPDTRFSLDNVQQLTETLIYLGSEGTDALFGTGVGPDDQSPDKNSISLYQPGLGLPSREYYSQPEIITNYREGLVSILGAILGNPTGNSPIDVLRREKMAENKLQLLSPEDVKDMVDRFIEFESQLAELTVPNDELQNPIELYNLMSIAQLHQNYPIVDWLKFFSSFTSEETSLPEHVIVTAPKFMQRLTDWLSNSSTRGDGATTESLREFLVIRTIMSNIDLVDETTRELYREMNSKIASGTTAPPSRARTCVGATSRAFGQLLGRYFVMKNFGGEPQRKQVANFMGNIQKSWSERLGEITWLDDETRAQAVDKVQKIKHKEAYSTIAPDVRSPESLGSYYAGVSVNTGDYFGNRKSARVWQTRLEWSKVSQEVDKAEWYMDPHEVNAYYTPTFNEIVVPAGILQNPFYHSDLPEYLNYGGIGVVIGHEITHAFDNSGRLYDGNGRLNTWWTNATSEAFESKSQCFVNQYNKFTVQGPGNTEYNVNGKMTLGENLADNGGVHAALMAMRKSLQENPQNNLALPELKQLSPEQLFFINFGRVWCTNMRPEMAVQRVRSDVHSPARARVNGAVQNSPEFAQAFQCKAGSQAMNPTDKCQIW